MTLYLDASALVKGFLIEVGSAEISSAAEASPAVATSAITYTEVRAALARALRQGRIDADERATIAAEFEARWSRFAVIDPDSARLREAGDLADRHTRHALRAPDAIHLASALRLVPDDPACLTFACWDLRLWRAAHDEGFSMLPANEPV